MKRTHTFQHPGLTITVHTRTGGDEMAQEVIYAGLVDYAEIVHPVKWHQVNTYTQIITQTDEIVGEFGMTLPDDTASVADHKAAFAGLMARTDGLVKAWRAALDKVDAAPVALAGSDPKGAAVLNETPPVPSTTGTPSSTPTTTGTREGSRASKP